ITGEDKDLRAGVLVQVADVLANGVGGALVPVGGLVGLLRREDLDESAAERVELVGVGDVAVEDGGWGLGQVVQAARGEGGAMSINRYLPAIGTAGLLRSLVSG